MLHHEYRAYLQSGAAPDRARALATLLGSALPLVGEALTHFAGGARSFQRPLDDDSEQTVHVGPTLPTAPVVGDLWVDTVELSAMVFVPSYIDPEDRDQLSAEAVANRVNQTSWLALRPVARFQYAAFLEATTTKSTFDAGVGDPFAPITALTHAAAGAYISWFGKQFPWESQYLAATEMGVPIWSEPAREWSGPAAFDDELFVAFTPNTLHTDPRDTEDVTDPEWRMLYTAREAPSSITFRSCVHTQIGLGTGPSRFARG